MKFLVSASFVLARSSDSASLWSEFKAEHSKFYNDTVDEQRFSVFEANVKFIEEVNARNLDFELALNSFADMPHEEFAVSYLGLREAKRGTVRGDSPSLSRHEWRGEPLPDTVDWADQGAVTVVKDQKMCGSCWAFSAVGALEGAAQLMKGELRQLSEQQFVDCSGDFDNYGCKGGLMDSAFKYVEAVDLCSEDSYPYEAQDGSCRTQGCEIGLEKGLVTGMVDVGHTDNDLMSAVAQQPVSVAIDAALPFFQFYRKGVFGGVCGGGLDHGVLAVGYGEWTTGKPYWKVKNSWGAKWGMDGYILLKRGTRPWMKTGECGILKSASYPVVSGSMVV